MNLIEKIEKIARSSEKSQLAPDLMRTLSPNLKALMEFLQCTKEQALLFAIFFSQTLEQGNVDYNDLARHLDVPVMRILKFKNDIDQLVKRRLIRQENQPGYRTKSRISYYVSMNVIDGTLKNRLTTNDINIRDHYDFLVQVTNMMDDAKDDASGFETLKEDFLELCRGNRHLPVAAKLLGSYITVHELLVLLFAVYQLINGEEEISLSEACAFLEGDKAFQFRVRREFMNGQSQLIRHGYLETRPGMFRSENDLYVTDAGMEYLFGEEAEKFMLRSNNRRTLTDPGKIAPVTLFLNRDEQRQIDTLEEMFSAGKFAEITGNMKSRNLKAGFTILFYGNPGTGKTESVYQLARRTGRGIVPVEISSTKSMWFGESEKLINKVFDDYRRLAASVSVTPILFFNEADGIFGRRTNRVESPVSQTLNTIQNIILQQMEDFEGILVATTNLTDNLDKAFDRRFLYKIKFGTPEYETRMMIMADKLPFLTPEAVRLLCGQFPLTGGQMANIAKKCEIQFLLSGKYPDTDEIMNFCSNEVELQGKNKIGF